MSNVNQNVPDSLTNLSPPINSMPIASESSEGLAEYKRNYLLSTYEFGLSLGVLAFGLLIIILEVYLLKGKVLSADLLVKFILVTLIITATLFLITAGFSNNQIAPAIGLFGTVAGYLLGKSTNTHQKE